MSQSRRIYCVCMKLKSEEDSWTDSYWTSQKNAVGEAKRIVGEIGYDEACDKYNYIRVIGRVPNVPGDAEDYWRAAYDTLVYEAIPPTD